jgi:uncharacterized protein
VSIARQFIGSRWLIGSQLLIGCVGIALLSGCIGSRSPAPAYYLLTARTQTKIATLDTSIGVGPVRVAPFLTRADITTHAGGGNMQFSESERWGEPLEQGIQRVLLQNINTLTGAETRNFPWRQSGIPQYAVRIDVTDLDRLVDSKAILEVSWMLEDLKSARVVKTQQERFSVSIGGSRIDGLTTAYSELFAQLAEHIAQAAASQNNN